MTSSQYMELRILDKVREVVLIMNINLLGPWELLNVDELCDL
jgi:hypothetical protein